MNDERWISVISVLVVLIVLVLIALSPKYEAETYTRLTGKHVTYWDAVWCDLRIQEQVK